MSIRYQQIAQAEKENKSTIICTIVECIGSCPRKEGTKMLVFGDGTTQGTVGGGSFEAQVIKDALKCYKNGKPILLTYNLDEHQQMMCGGKTKVFFEALKPQSKLYVFGSGHVGNALGNIAMAFGFDVLLIDPREKNTSVQINYLRNEYLNAIESLDFDSSTYIAITTPSHQSDFEVLAATINKEYKYIGLLGSAKKVKNARSYLLDNKISKDLIEQVNMPIGIRFNAESPDEIALSILAKLIDVRNS